VYNELGGRQNDVGTVKYESDLTAMPYRWLLALRGKRGLPIHYEVLPYTNWTGLAVGEYLDIDWDFFALAAYPEKAIQEHADAFINAEFHVIPEKVYVCYSPDYSQPSRLQFQGFVADLAGIFKAEVIHVHHQRDLLATSPYHKKYMPVPLLRLTRQIYYKASLSLRKRGIY
jgi:hypothetical protein